ncbi:hypothetical protein FS749_004959 [Ceratobasidium sp. UAMH 11750]|nr:hypothetical protein FS749_004959 [Ceratobasidium sp. UAMH 11750]
MSTPRLSMRSGKPEPARLSSPRSLVRFHCPILGIEPVIFNPVSGKELKGNNVEGVPRPCPARAINLNALHPSLASHAGAKLAYLASATTTREHAHSLTLASFVGVWYHSRCNLSSSKLGSVSPCSADKALTPGMLPSSFSLLSLPRSSLGPHLTHTAPH